MAGNPWDIGDEMTPNTKVVIEEFKSRGIDVTLLDGEQGLFIADIKGRKHYFHESLGPTVSAPTVLVTGNKYVTSQLARSFGFSVPENCIVEKISEAIPFLAKHLKLVAKPLVGEMGQDVVVGIESEAELNRTLQSLSGPTLIERYVRGKDVRALVIGYKFCAALERTPALVIGDGISTVRQLIEQRNRDIRKIDPTAGIPFDSETLRVLNKQGVGLESVLQTGREIFARLTANFHTGGTIRDVTEELGEALKKTAEQLALAFRIPVVGIDFCLPDLRTSDYWLIELNERPNLAFHMTPEKGKPRNTAKVFADHILCELGNGGENIPNQ